MNLTADNFDTTLVKKIQEIDNYFRSGKKKTIP